MDLEPLPENLARWAAAKPLVFRVWIFGSRARDDFRPDSDLDIAVELDEYAYSVPDESGGIATWMFETEGWKEELQVLCPYPVQLEQYIPGATPTIENALKRSSRLVYEKPRTTAQR